MKANRSDSGIAVKILRNSVLILAVIVFVSIISNFRNKAPDTETALFSDAIEAKEFKGVFIRSEKVVTYSGEGVLSYNVADGGKTGGGTVIAQVYPDDEQIARNRQIAQLEKELAVLKKIQNPGTLESAQPASLSENIDESFRSMIYSRDMKDYSALKSEMEDLLVEMSTYQIITQQAEGFKQQIIDINAQLADLRSAAVSPSETIRSDSSAYFVSYCDGYEEELTPERLDKLTAAEINSITDRKSDDPTVVGKLIDGYSWYLAGVMDNSRKQYAIGDAVKLRFDSSSDVYDAVISDIRDDGDPAKSIVIIECSRFSEELVSHRAEKCELIKGEHHGLKVPREAIRFVEEKQQTTGENGEIAEESSSSIKGVYILKGEQKLFKKIDVIYEGSDYVLSEPHEEDSSYLALYDDIMTEGD
ncbi:MAG: hypothetical protein NC093_00320 [Alistipes sp.]|nr:hypothetical protein [Alistipes sp.]